MTKLDELRKTIEKTGNSQRFAIALLLPDSNYFIEYLFGQSGPTTHQGLAVRDEVEKAGVRQDLTADEKELISGIVTKAFITGFTYGDNWKNKSAGTKAKAAKFFNALADALKENKGFSDIIVTYLDDEMLDQVKLVTDDNNTIAKIAMWIVARSVMIPVTPICADATSSNANVHVDTSTGKVVIDAEYRVIEPAPAVQAEPQQVEQNHDDPNDNPKSTANDGTNIVDKRNDAIVKAVAALRELGIPDDKIYETLGIKTVSGSEGGTVKASTSYRDTGEKASMGIADVARSNTPWFIRDISNTYHDANSERITGPLHSTGSLPNSSHGERSNAASRFFAAQANSFKENNPSDDAVANIPVDFASNLLDVVFGSLD